MSEALNDFLVDLASDPDRLHRFTIDPLSELDDRPLTAEERAAILARDPARLRAAMGGLQAQTNQGTQGKAGGGKPPRKGPPPPSPPKPPRPKKRATKRPARKTGKPSGRKTGR